MGALEGPGALQGSARSLATPGLPSTHLQRGKLRHSLAGKLLVPLGRGDEVPEHQPPAVGVPCLGNCGWLWLLSCLIQSHCQGVRGQQGWGGRGQDLLWWGLRQTHSKVGVSNYPEVARRVLPLLVSHGEVTGSPETLREVAPAPTPPTKGSYPPCPTRPLSPEAAAASWARRQRRRQVPGESGHPMLPTPFPNAACIQGEGTALYGPSLSGRRAEPLSQVRRRADNIQGLSPSPAQGPPSAPSPPWGHSCPPPAREVLQPVPGDQGTSWPPAPMGAAAYGTPRSGRGGTGQSAVFADRLSWAGLDLPCFP